MRPELALAPGGGTNLYPGFGVRRNSRDAPPRTSRLRKEAVLHKPIPAMMASDPHKCSVLLMASLPQDLQGQGAACAFTLRNTGAAAPWDPKSHPQEVAAYLTADIYRLSVAVNGEGHSTRLQNARASTCP